MVGKKMFLDELKAKAQFKGTRRNVNFRLPRELDAKIEEIVKQTGASYTDVLIKLIQTGLQSLKK